MVALVRNLNFFIKRLIFRIIKILVSEGDSYIVLFGALKGLRWIYSSGYAHYWMGTYEKVISDTYIKYLKKDMVVYDLGANVGYYTLISSKTVGDNGRVYAFEPLPYNLYYLRKHVEINGIKNIEIFELAVSCETGKTMFTNCNNNVANTICKISPLFQSAECFEVNMVRLNDLIQNGEILPPQLMKIDVEGSEYDVLKGADFIIGEYHPTIFLSTHNCHSKGIHKQCCDYLLAMGYNLHNLEFHKQKTEMNDPWYDIVAEFNNA